MELILGWLVLPTRAISHTFFWLDVDEEGIERDDVDGVVLTRMTSVWEVAAFAAYDPTEETSLSNSAFAWFFSLFKWFKIGNDK